MEGEQIPAKSGVMMGGEEVWRLMFADDGVFLERAVSKMRNLMEWVAGRLQRWGFKVSVAKSV